LTFFFHLTFPKKEKKSKHSWKFIRDKTKKKKKLNKTLHSTIDLSSSSNIWSHFVHSLNFFKFPWDNALFIFWVSSFFLLLDSSRKKKKNSGVGLFFYLEFDGNFHFYNLQFQLANFHFHFFWFWFPMVNFLSD